MTLQCVNLSRNFANGTYSEYIYIEGEPFDKFLLFKCLQIFLYCLEIFFRIGVDGRIIYVICKRDQLQTCGNIAVCVFLISDLALLIHHAILPSVILLNEAIWIHRIVGGMEAVLNVFFGIFNYLCLTVLTLEKFFYTNYPFRHMKYFNIRKTIVYMLLCIIPTVVFCSCVHYKFRVTYISNTHSMFYCFKGEEFSGKHLYWITPVFFIIIILYCHISIMVDLCHNQCHIPQLPGFNMDRVDIGFVARFVKAAISVLILTTSVFVDLLLRVLFQYMTTPIHINRSIWVLSILLRMLNPLIILWGNPPLRNYVFNSGFHRAPTWLPKSRRETLSDLDNYKPPTFTDTSETETSPPIDRKCYTNVRCLAKETFV